MPKYIDIVDEALKEPENIKLLNDFNKAKAGTKKCNKICEEIFNLLEALCVDWGSEIPEQFYDSCREDGEQKLRDYFWKQVEIKFPDIVKIKRVENKDESSN